MSEFERLKTKIKERGALNGRPKAFFCCHPEDFDIYFSEITDEILNVQDNIVFFYHDPNEEFTDNGEIEDCLNEMQLMVVPVTERFLTENNYGKDVELAYAMKHNLSVLPLIQEQSLDKLFENVFGKLQYLDKNKLSEDGTALSYEERLRKFLDAVILDADTIQKIRDAFDAYIFLSYRKKDRKYAQEIMRLIHENDFCRDIAIWYDEFLTPGENFNEAIVDAMKKSHLFVLAVTPSLLEQNNYVMDIEYPNAKSADMTIMPIESVETDRAVLREYYSEIPEPVRVEDTEALAERLRSVLGDIALRENDSDKRHKFFMGLAYLSGIDVEVNVDKAIQLLKESVSLVPWEMETSIPEAALKLSNIYEYGIGVKRNMIAACAWMGHYTRILTRQCDMEHMEKAFFLRWSDAVKELVRLLDDTGDEDDALDQIQRLRNTYPYFQHFNWEGEREYRIELEILIAKYAFGIGIDDENITKLVEAKNIAVELYKEDVSDIYRLRLLRDCYRLLGKAYTFNGKEKDLFSVYKNLALVIKSLWEHNECTESDDYIACMCCAEAADAFADNGMKKEAMENCDSCLKYTNQSNRPINPNKKDEILLRLSLAQCKIEFMGALSEDTFEIFDKRLFEVEVYEQRNESRELKRILMEMYNLRAEFLMKLGRYEDALKEYNRAVSFPATQSGQGKCPVETRLFIMAHIGQINAMLSCYGRIEERYYDARADKLITAIISRLNEEELINKYGCEMGLHYMAAGDVAMSAGEKQKALDYYLRAFDTLQKAMKINKNHKARYGMFEVSIKLSVLNPDSDYKAYAVKTIEEMAEVCPNYYLMRQ